jgi:hypothetical protein
MQVEETLNNCWDIYFCFARAYENTSQAEEVRLFILSTMAMFSQYTHEDKYLDFTVEFLCNTNSVDSPSMKKLCKDKNDMFDWTVRYYNFTRGNLKYKLKTKDDLEKEMATEKMTKSWWGPRIWYLLHSFASYSPEICTYEYFMCYKAFVVTLSKLLPCHECRAHLQSNLKTLPMDCYGKTRLSLFGWSFKLHNIVNEQLNKEPYLWDKAVEKYGFLHNQTKSLS